MKLLFDFGNTCCKWAYLENQQLQKVTAYSYKSESSADRVHEVINHVPFATVKEIHAVSVLGGNFEQKFCSQVLKLSEIETKFHLSKLNGFGVLLAYSDPLSYGADRYAALVAAHHKMPGAKIIVDCGTATTIDVIDKQGQHLGGLIIPGVELMCSALVKKASGISTEKQTNLTHLFNDNTADAFYSGSVLTHRYGVCAIIEEIQHEIGQHATILITGGQSDMISHAIEQYLDCPNLVLEGLAIMQG
ncbi:MAG: type III pantothenate kinase [Gammaproteobacteria bacterium]|nr:type III pantothenate kinase [Gammaproteobacteria bacterium]